MSDKYLTESQVDLCIELIQATPLYQSSATYIENGEILLTYYQNLKERTKTGLPKWFKKKYPENIKTLDKYIEETEDSLEASKIFHK
jgi:uncharacterized protein (DUF885 family)